MLKYNHNKGAISSEKLYIITFLFCNGSDAVTAVAPTMSIPCGMLK